MSLTKTYLGYTNGMKPLSVSRISAQLDKWLRIDKRCHKFKTFIPILVLSENWRPINEKITHGEIVDNYGHKSFGELKAPRNSYGLQSRPNEDGLGYWVELNKTQYEYALYIYQTFGSYTDALDFDAEEQARERKAEEARIAAEKAEKQREIDEKEAENRFEDWLAQEAMKYVGTNAELMVEKAFKKYGDNSRGFWNAFKVLVCVDNLDRERCRDYLVSVLHNDNKSSIKLFELYTGIKLPRGYKERSVFIASGLRYSDITRRSYDLSRLTTYAELNVDGTTTNHLGYKMKWNNRVYYLRLDRSAVKATEEHGICVASGTNALDVIVKVGNRFADPHFTEKLNDILAHIGEARNSSEVKLA